LIAAGLPRPAHAASPPSSSSSSPSPSPARSFRDSSPRAEGFVDMLIDLDLPVEAAREARRLMLVGGPDALSARAAFRVGMGLALAGEPGEAVFFLAQATAATDDPARADRWQLATGVALLRARSFPHAAHLFARVEAFGADAATRDRATRLRCIGEILARDGPAARTCISGLPAARHAGELEDRLAALEIDAHRRAVIGGILSALIPGLGQLTAGNPGDAFLALAVNGAWATAVYLLIADGALFDASLLGLGVGVRYYIGNIRNGAEAWRAAAESRRAAASERLVRLVGAPENADVPVRVPVPVP
jgi:TM2 domain-containing membrane protein YozV